MGFANVDLFFCWQFQFHFFATLISIHNYEGQMFISSMETIAVVSGKILFTKHENREKKKYEQKNENKIKVCIAAEIVVVAGRCLTDESGNVIANAIVMLKYLFESL